MIVLKIIFVDITGFDGTGNPVSVGFHMPSRYDKNIFYLTPFYHHVFPVEKMIFSDVDVVFKVVDIKLLIIRRSLLIFQISLERLYTIFSSFSDDNLYSFAPDLTPHYFTMTQDWR